MQVESDPNFSRDLSTGTAKDSSLRSDDTGSGTRSVTRVPAGEEPIQDSVRHALRIRGVIVREHDGDGLLVRDTHEGAALAAIRPVRTESR